MTKYGATMGAPSKLLRKTTMVKAGPDRLPIHTLTFAMPDTNALSSGGGKILHPSQVRLDLGDVIKMVIPGYKPKSYSMSSLRDTEFDVTVKVYENGRASGYLDRLRIHDEIHVFGMSKHSYRDETPSNMVGIIAYGVGITEALPICKAELRNHQSNVTLLWAARTMADTFWHDELNALREEYPDTFRLQYIFSRERQPDALYGRIDTRVLSNVFGRWKNPRFLSVGTKEMMAQTDDMLQSIGFPIPQHALLKKKHSM